MKPAKKYNECGDQPYNTSSPQSSQSSSQSLFGSQSVNRLTFKSLDSDEITTVPNDEDVMKLMQERLPSYVVNCFVSSDLTQ